LSPDSATATSSQRRLALWLFVCCLLLFAMILLGGATRLTHSGLSMVEWRPIAGILPPLDEAEWREAFGKYQQFPEFKKLHPGMDLAGFQSIFWLEFIHRLWGRMLGLAFLLPLLWFAATRQIPGALVPRLVVVFLLGGLQGAMGWYMVKSGLKDRPDVSQYRLVAHLAFALVLYGYLFRLALALARGPAPTPLLLAALDPVPEPSPAPAAHPGLAAAAAFLTGLVFLTALSGGFVAGLDAGFAYNTFPLMGDQLIPEGLALLSPIWRNPFENLITVQFDHRLLASLTATLAVFLWLAALRHRLARPGRWACHALLLAVLVQFALGVATLLLIVPVPLGVAHQGGAVLLFTACLWASFELSRSPHGGVSPGPT